MNIINNGCPDITVKMGDHSLRFFDVLRSKNFLILVLFILATSVSIWLVSVPTPNIRTIMTETGKQFSNLKNMNMMQSKKTPPTDVTMADTYLELLGFTDTPALYPDAADPNLNVPVIVTGVMSSNYENAFKLIESVQKHLPSKHVRIFDLGLNSYEIVALKKRCNESTLCSVKSFDFDKFPGHVHDIPIRAYKPLAVQEALNEFSAIIWTDNEEYFVVDAAGLEPVLERAQRCGLAAWGLDTNEPTSTLTHPSMFQYFKTRPDLFFFHKMVGTRHLVLYNLGRVHTDLMRPWVQCALHQDCIFPRGAQNVGCNYHRKPRYRYSGCHRYDMSALNVILGRMFDYEVKCYLSEEAVFGVEPAIEASPTNLSVRSTTKMADVTGAL